MAQFGSGPANWVISPEESNKNEAIFNNLKPNAGKISGEQAKKYFMMSNLPTPVLGHIWKLSDMDNDGKMTFQEFNIALHLIQAKCRGTEVPKVLPYSLKSSSLLKKSVFDTGFSTPASSMMPSMNNGSIGTPLISSGGILTPMQPSGTSSSMSGTFATQSNQTGGFHTGFSGSNTFPRNMPSMQLSNSTAKFHAGSGARTDALSSLDSLSGLSSGWGQPKADTSFQAASAQRASSLNIKSQTLPQNSFSSLTGLQFGSTPLVAGPNIAQAPPMAQPLSMGQSVPFGQHTSIAQPGAVGQHAPLAKSASLGQPASSGGISPGNRMKFMQMFKAADHEKNGFIRGEQARQILIQSGIPPDKLAKIWDLSDINKDGNLDLDEFMIAMHLIETVKAGQPVPVSLPQNLIPAAKKSNEPEPVNDALDIVKKRSESVSSMGKPDAVSFEDRRKDNFEKGRLELERRRKEIQERTQREKEERERKEREEEEKKRKMREEAERRRLQQLENERRQKEEMEREQEDQRRKLIEERHAAQLEAERQRQREWEKRRKEELLNQKGLEEDIVAGLKLRLEKLKGELNQETTKRDGLASDLNSRKITFNDLVSSITQLNKSREFGAVQTNMFKTDIQKMITLVAQLKEERERLNVEINKRDSTKTGEALGGVRASIQQTKVNIPRLKSHLKAMEAETDNLLKENDTNTRQIPPIKAALTIKLDENNRYKQLQEQKKRELQAARQRIEEETRRLDAINRQKREEEERLKRQAEAKRKKEEMALKQREDERRKQKEKEQQAMKLEQQRQEESLRRIQQAQAAEKQSKLEKAKQITREALQKKQELKTQDPSPQPTKRPAPAAIAKPNVASLFSVSKEPAINADLLGLDTNIEAKIDNTKNISLPAPPKKEKRPVAPPRPKTRPVVAASDKVKPKTEEPTKNDTWGALAELDSGRRKEEEDMMKQLKEQAEKVRQEEEQRIKKEEEERRIQEEARKKEEARKQLEEEKRKREEALLKRKEEERKKGEAERKRCEEELKLKEQMELERQKKRKEEERKRGEEERRRWEEEQQKIEMERQKQEEAEKRRQEEERLQDEAKKQKEAEVRKKIEEMQKMKQLRKQQQQQQQQEVEQTTQSNESEYQSTTHVEKPPERKQRPRFKVLFAFEARHADELSLNENDIVQVEEEDTRAPPGWYFGFLGARSGLFPTNYVEKLPKDTFSDYVDLDKNATAPPSAPITLDQPDTSQAVGNQPALSEPVVDQPVSQPKLSQPAPVSQAIPIPGPKKALLPKAKPLSKPAQNTAPEPLPKPTGMKQRTSSQLETVPEHDRTSSYGSSEGTEASSSLTAGGSSVKSIASSFDKQDCYENVQPPTSIEGPSASETTSKPVEGLQAVALYPYRGKKDDHLSFNKNDQIIVQEQQDLWWYGECSNKTGWFPKSYVKVIGTVKNQPSAQDDFCDVSSVASSSSSVATEYSGGEHSFIGECVAIFDYSGIDGDLSFSEGDTIKITKKEGDWWEGVLKAECGFFPANYVKVKENVEAPKKPEVATVIAPFVASDGKEISLNPGQLIHVMKKDPGGWWQGELQARGKKRQVGWFPATCVKLLAQTKAPEQEKVVEAPMAEPIMEEDIYAVPQKREDPADQVLALFSYTAQNEDELTFYKGSVINVIKKEGDWWKGELNGQVGMFPFNYVQILTDLPDNSGQWEGSFDTAVLNAMSKGERERQNYIHELINTEQTYMDDLSLTLEIFYNPLAEAHILNEQELNTVFVNWREIIMCNTKFLKALLVRKTMSVDNKIEAIGDILVEQIPRFTPYIRFCSCQLKACKLLQHKVENDPEFKQFEKKCAGDRRLRQNLPLSSYLLKPLQRITKYPLIIKQIIRHTPEEHHDRPNLEQALEKVEELCSQINESIRMLESANRLEWLQSHVNLEGLGEKLVFNSQTNCLGQRKYLHHSTLYKHKSNKELRAFLFNDFLLLCRQQGSNTLARTFTNIFKDNPEGEATLSIYKKPIFLNEIVIKMPTDPDVNDTLFYLSHIDRIYLFRTETKNERNVWINKLQKASEHFIETERFQRKRAHRARSVLGQGVGRLTLVITEGCDLKASDPNGTSDPYCEVSMGSQEHKTKVIAKTLNPKWNSQMIFTVKDLDQDVLCITVFDRDFFSPNGRTELSISSLLKEGPGPWNKRLLLHEVPTGEILVTASFKKFEKR